MTNHDEQIAKCNQEIQRLTRELDSRTLQLRETEEVLDQIKKQHEQLNQRVAHLTETLIDSQEVR